MITDQQKAEIISYIDQVDEHRKNMGLTNGVKCFEYIRILLKITPEEPQPKYKKLYEMQRKRSQRAERRLIELVEKMANPAMCIEHVDFKKRYDEASAELQTLKRRINKFRAIHIFGRFWIGIERKDD